MKPVSLAGVTLLLSLHAVVASEFHVYVGTYTGPKSKGIYLSRFNSTSGRLTEPQLAAETRNPSFLAVHPTGRFLYAVGEVNDAQGKRAGAVVAYAVDPKTGKLTLLNQQTSGGTGPCHISVDATGKCALVANYGSGSIAALPIKPDGSLGEAATTIQHTGSSVNPQRQAGPHAHFICPSPDNRFALAADLGLDKVLVYHLDAATAKLETNNPPYAVVAHGAGPRHLAFHPNGKFAYVINEMALTVTTFRYDSARAVLFEEQTVSTLPAGYTATARDSGGEIAMHPNGKFVYGSNRGHDSIAVFAVDASTGKLALIQSEPAQGKIPRHFAIDPSGKWLLAESQNSDSIAIFAIDATNGKLSPTGERVSVGSPVCAVFVSARSELR
ncbi:MAG TPA: lactonase family protein [Verrucomicrobiae bacterium]|nr:lactonase family protein [Verrucomicrobiae bacterium]